MLLLLFGLVSQSEVFGAQSQVTSLLDMLDGCRVSLGLTKIDAAIDFRWYPLLLEPRRSSLISLTWENLCVLGLEAI